MNSLGASNSECVNVMDMAETDIFQMLMTRDRVAKNDFLKLCEETSREIKEHSRSYAGA